ncbi:endo-1,4-beta-xylanase [Novosphingobium sp. RD2P27]|uniref:Beta-xylanase n=1 Tax=Novosphingobium kalidii TaxID=3230299 RepID=A0ABV2D2Q4_9SPHN
MAEFTRGWARREFIIGALACSACGPQADGAGGKIVAGLSVPLKEASTLPIGTAITAADLADAQLVRLIKENFSQLTPASEMKMGVVINDQGKLNFGAAERLASFASDNDMRLHGHTLVWYRVEPSFFLGLADDPKKFRAEYLRYIDKFLRRFKGRVSGWDVVNEPISADGTGLRDSVWSRTLGKERYIALAFKQAAASDPNAVAFINEYGLEARPAKRLAYMRLIERLLKKDVPIGGVGTQTHISVDLPERAVADTLRDLASFGLPVHVSELDITLGRGAAATAGKLKLQARRARQVVEAYMQLPSKQRYAITLWGVRDRDSWLRMPPYDPDSDRPLAFDDKGQPKPMLSALAAALKGAS